MVVYGPPAQGTRERIGMSDRNVLHLDCVVWAHAYEFAKVHQTVDFKSMQVHVCKLYSNADLK